MLLGQRLKSLTRSCLILLGFSLQLISRPLLSHTCFSPQVSLTHTCDAPPPARPPRLGRFGHTVLPHQENIPLALVLSPRLSVLWSSTQATWLWGRSRCHLSSPHPGYPSLSQGSVHIPRAPWVFFLEHVEVRNYIFMCVSI